MSDQPIFEYVEDLELQKTSVSNNSHWRLVLNTGVQY